MQHACVSYYSDHAQQFHRSYQQDANRLERVALWRKLIGQYVFHAPLAYDIGCGSGVLTCLLAAQCDKVIAIDGAKGMLEIAKKTAAEQGLGNITFEQHHLPVETTHTLPLAGGLICSSVVEYLDSPIETLHFFNRILKKDAIALWSVSNHDALSRRLVRFMHRLTGVPRYIGLLKHFMTPETIAPLLAQTGFEAVEYLYCGRADMLNRLLGCFLPERYASNMIIVVAKKL